MSKVPFAHLLLGSLLLLGLVSCSPTATPELGPELDASNHPTLTVATFNVHRFFDTVCDSRRCGAGEYEALLDELSLDARARELAFGMAGLDADIVLFQEIESQSNVDAISRYLSERLPVAVIGETAGTASLDVGIFTNAALLETRRHRDAVLTTEDGTTTRFAREFFELHLAWTQSARDTQQPDVIVFVAHFVSKASDPGPRRLAEAQKACEIITQTLSQYPQALMIFGGDLNDTPGSAPINALEQCPGLRRTGNEIDAESMTTYTYNGVGSALDHIFVGATAGGAYVEGSARVFRDSWSGGYAGSDHGALRVVFELFRD
ncbi:MAG: endonuclease/exonuclease/phosphatase family protein [Myxococcota bacterium]|nr:endonuclease/exonuclease/phosphatase family protein [Myxococcota bacterium]